MTTTTQLVDALKATHMLDESGHLKGCGYDLSETCACIQLPALLSAALPHLTPPPLTVFGSEALFAVHLERHEQDRKWGPYRDNPDGVGPTLLIAGYRSADYADAVRQENEHEFAEGRRLSWANILLKQFSAAIATDDATVLRSRLVKVAAVAVAWIERLDERKAVDARLDEVCP